MAEHKADLLRDKDGNPIIQHVVPGAIAMIARCCGDETTDRSHTLYLTPQLSDADVQGKIDEHLRATERAHAVGDRVRALLRKFGGLPAALLALFLLLIPAAGRAQNFTTFTASNIQNAAGQVLVSGTFYIQGTDANNNAISFQCGGGGQVVRAPYYTTVTEGVISSPTICNPATTAPAGIFYHIWVIDTTSGSATYGQKVLEYYKVQWSGGTFDFDTYAPTGTVVVPPTGGTVNGPLNINGNLNITGSCTGCGGGGSGGGLGNGTSVIDATTETGSDMSVKINAAVTALPSTGGVVDARGFTGSQAMSANVSTTGAKPVTILIGNVTLTRASGKQFLLAEGSVLKGLGGTASQITGNDTTAAIGGVNTSGGATQHLDIAGLDISNAGTGPCMDFLRVGTGILNSTIHGNILNCATGILYVGYYNSIFGNNFGASTGGVFWAGTLGDANLTGAPSSNHVYDNVYIGGAGGTGDFIRNGYSDKFDGRQDYEGESLGVFSSAQAIHFDFAGDVESTYCNSRNAWAANTAYGVGAVVWDGTNCELNISVFGSGYTQTSGSSAPSWPVIEGTTTTDNGVTWIMYLTNSISPFAVLGPAAQTNYLTGNIAQNPYITDLNYVVNASTTNTIDVQGNNAFGTGGTPPYSRIAGPEGYQWAWGAFGNQPGLGQSIAQADIGYYNPSSAPTALNGISLDVPSASQLCTVNNICGHQNLRLGQLIPLSGINDFGPVSITALPTPPAPTLTVVGTAGSATCTYYLVAHVEGSVTLPGPSASVTNCPNTLNSSNYVKITFPSTIGSGIPDPWSNASWDILKGTTATSLATAIGVQPGGIYKDQGGSTSSYSAPSRNTTGDFAAAGIVQAGYEFCFLGGGCITNWAGAGSAPWAGLTPGTNATPGNYYAGNGMVILPTGTGVIHATDAQGMATSGSGTQVWSMNGGVQGWNNQSGVGGLSPVYDTPSSAVATNISATNMVATTGAQHDYMFNWTISLVTAGTGCSGTTTVNLNAVFTDPNAGSPTTESIGTITIANSGNGTVGFVAEGSDNILAKTGSAVQYSTSSYTLGSGCSVDPVYQVTPTLVQLW